MGRDRSRSRSASPDRHWRRRENDGRSRGGGGIVQRIPTNNLSDSSEKTMLREAWRPVKDDPHDFEAWTRLLKVVERVDDTREARDAYDRFFRYWPYCYGYWIKFAELEKQHRHWERALDVYERGLDAIPLSVELWLSYIAYIKELAQGQSQTPKTIERIRSVYMRAIEACGLEFRSDKLWSEYIEWLIQVGEVREATEIFDVLLLTPTAGYASHFERFKSFVGAHEPDRVLTEEEYNEITDVVYARIREELEGQPMFFIDEHEVVEDDGEEFVGAPGEEPPKKIVRERKHLDVALKAFRDEIIERRHRHFLENEKEVGMRWNYESAIKRPYFHVKPLEREQLNNWLAYLDFEITKKKKQRIECLFGRCVIACALYEEFWVKYGSYLESIDDKAAAEKVYKQATGIHCSRKPGVHLAYSAFEETRGNEAAALSILSEFDRRHSNYTAVQLRMIAIEKRRLVKEESTDFSSVVKRYEKFISEASLSRKLSSFWSLKLARFHAKVLHDRRMARKVVKAAINRDKDNLQLYTQLVDLACSSTHPKDSDVISALDFAIDSPDLSAEERYQFSARKLEYLEELGNDSSLLNPHLVKHLEMAKALENPAMTIFHGRRGAPLNKEKDAVDVKRIKLEDPVVSASPLADASADLTAASLDASTASQQHPPTTQQILSIPVMGSGGGGSALINSSSNGNQSSSFY